MLKSFQLRVRLGPSVHDSAFLQLRTGTAVSTQASKVFDNNDVALYEKATKRH